MSKDFVISGSLLSADFSRLKDHCEEALEAGVDWFHLDVFDFHYVPNLTFGAVVPTSLRKAGITAPFDAHLAVEPALPVIDSFLDTGVNYISFHPDACEKTDAALQKIKDAGVKAGLVLRYDKPLDLLNDYWADVDLVLLMSAPMGFSGGKFQAGIADKIKAARAKLEQSNSAARLQVDGGISPQNIGLVAAAGVDTIVAGNAVFKSGGSIAEAVSALRQGAKGSKN